MQIFYYINVPLFSYLSRQSENLFLPSSVWERRAGALSLSHALLPDRLMAEVTRDNLEGPDQDEAISRRIVGDGTAPQSVSAYLDPNYWDERFAGEEHYEWLKDYSHFGHLIRRHIQPSHSVLEIGCGNSRLSEALLEDGVADITSIDISGVAVDRMRKRLRAKGLKGIKVLEADMLDLPFDSGCFDIVIEKGTMDVLFVDSGDPWNPRPLTVDKVLAMLKGVHRVLKSDGTFISISFGQPHFRRPFFEDPELTWSFEYQTFGEEFHYFFYTLQKGRRRFDSTIGNTEKFALPPICLLHEELEGEDYIFRTSVDELNT
uniref:EEF1A lysine methyltransferase 4 n=1 Tax=Anthurium amnicola TaxID=1678845 RepID=A0A1D1YW65_9ARAE